MVIELEAVGGGGGDAAEAPVGPAKPNQSKFYIIYTRLNIIYKCSGEKNTVGIF